MARSWNPRVWLRDWLNRPTRAEQDRIDADARFMAEYRASLLKDSEERVREANSLRAQRAAQASTPVSGDA